MEIEVDSMENDGTQSWTVISRDVGTYVTELPEENKEPIHREELASSAGKLAAIKQKEQFISSSSPSSTMMPISQQIWNDISAVGKIMTRPTGSRS